MSAPPSGPHGPRDVDRARLVPVDAVGADDVVEQPALLLEPLHMRLAALVHDRLRDALHEILPWRSFAPDLPARLGESCREVSRIDSPRFAGIARCATLNTRQQQETRMPGTDHQNPLDRRRRIRLLPGAARGRRQGAGGGAGLRRARRRRGHPRSSPRSSPATASSRRRPICSGGRCRGRSATTTSGPRSARSRGWRRSRPASATWWTRWRIFARCRSSTAAPRRWASATAGPTPSSGRSGSATPPASPATARRCWTTSRSSTASPSRSASSGATRTTARRRRCWTPTAPVPSRMKNVEVHIFPGILHGYMMPGARRRSTRRRASSPCSATLAILDGLRGGGAAMRKAS